MADELTHLVQEGGVTGKHALRGEGEVTVGPATAAEFNTIRPGIISIACWRLEDIRFEFDSSIVRPETKAELASLAALVEEHPPISKSEKLNPPQEGCPLSVFGHADPVGNDEYNKQLSGRRAKAIYALLTRRAEFWEQLFQQPVGNDRWGRRALEMMLEFVSAPAADAQGTNGANPSSNGGQNGGRATDPAAPRTTPEEVAQHERDPGKRRALFLAYMDKLCGPNLKLEKRDFLGHGDDTRGKGDFQGCSEFNPILIFSQEDQTRFEETDDRVARNAANSPNRRVVVLLFRKGTRVTPARWPCPRADEPTAACRKRFWSDGERRRSRRLPDEARKFEKTKDTFACRFYHRLTDASPCEGGASLWVIRLLETSDKPIDERRPLANLPFSVTGVGGEITEFRGTTDADGVLRIPVRDNPAVMKLVVAGTELSIFGGSLKSLKVEDLGVFQRLSNLGFEGQLRAFQELHGLTVENTPGPAFRKRLQELHGS